MTKPVTILHVRNSIAYGGVETTMLGWLDAVDRSRFRCPIALFSERNNAEEAFRTPFAAHGHEILNVPWHPGRRFRSAVQTLEHHIRETGAQLLHTHDWRSDVVGWYAARRTGVPIMTTVYVWFRRPLHIRVKETIDVFYIRRFNLVTAVCEATRCQTVARGVAAGKTSVLISGISPARAAVDIDHHAVRARFGLTENEVAFVYAARFYPEKAHATLIEAFHGALAREPGIRLLLLGKGPLEGVIRTQIEQLGLSGKVLLPGFIPDVPAVLAAMDVMVHASLAEGIPLAVYEGMLAGLPVIGSDVDGTPEVVIPGRTGWLVPPKNVPALLNQIVISAQAKDLRYEFGHNAKELVLSEYCIDKAVARLQSTWDGLLQQCPGATA
jgi:glycosyltransferase involved in cell wall biosynthesis